MVSNNERAEWAQTAVQAFADECMFGQISTEALSDLICDLGHFAERVLELPRKEVVKILEIGIGAWLAESRHPDEEPEDNDIVRIVRLSGMTEASQ